MKKRLALIVGLALAMLSISSGQEVKLDARTQGKAERSTSVAVRLRNAGKEPLSVRLEAVWLGTWTTPQDAYVAAFTCQSVELAPNEERKLEMASGGGRSVKNYDKMVGWGLLVIDTKTGKIIAKTGNNPRNASIAEGRPYAHLVSQ